MNKINDAANPPSLAYRVEGHGLACRIVWEGEVDLRPDQIMGHGTAPRNEPGQRRPGRPPTAIEVARNFLLTALSAGPVPTAQIMARAREQCIAERTLARARADLSVVPETVDGVNTMRLPEPPTHNDSGIPPFGRPDSDRDDDTTDDPDYGSGYTPYAD